MCDLLPWKHVLTTPLFHFTLWNLDIKLIQIGIEDVRYRYRCAKFIDFVSSLSEWLLTQVGCTFECWSVFDVMADHNVLTSVFSGILIYWLAAEHCITLWSLYFRVEMIGRTNVIITRSNKLHVLTRLIEKPRISGDCSFCTTWTFGFGLIWIKKLLAHVSSLRKHICSRIVEWISELQFGCPHFYWLENLIISDFLIIQF